MGRRVRGCDYLRVYFWRHKAARYQQIKETIGPPTKINSLLSLTPPPYRRQQCPVATTTTTDRRDNPLGQDLQDLHPGWPPLKTSG